MRFRDAQRTVLKGLRLNISSMLVGASGIGKSQMVEQVARDYASELGLKLVKNKTNPSATVSYTHLTLPTMIRV